MNARTNYLRFSSFFIALTAFLTLLGCGSFQGASYFSSDGIYTTEVQPRTEQPTETATDNSNYYSNYFKDAAQGTNTENEMYFTDAENYSSEGSYINETEYVEDSQIPWGQKTTQTEIIFIDRTPNFLWGLSGFAFRASPFWNNYYFNDPFRFGYGVYGTPFINPYINPYFGGGYAGYWGYDPFFTPFGYNPGYRFGYGYRWNRWNRWNRFGSAHNGYYQNNAYAKDYQSTVARIKSGRGEKSYEGSKRGTDNIQDRNAKNGTNGAGIVTSNRINAGRGMNSLGTTYLLTNRRDNILGEKTAGKSRTARPVFGSTSGASDLSSSNKANINLSKGVQGNSTGRFSQSRYRSLGARQTPKTTSPRANRSSSTSRGTTTRRVNSSTYKKSPTRNYSTGTTRRSSNKSYRTSAPSRSYNSSGGSRSYSSGGSSRSSSPAGGRSSSGGRRNQ